LIDTECRRGLQRLSIARKLKEDGAAPLDSGDGMVMKDGKQVAQPVGGRKGLKQAGFALHGGSLIKDGYIGRRNV
jgi:hypothetical protein